MVEFKIKQVEKPKTIGVQARISIETNEGLVKMVDKHNKDNSSSLYLTKAELIKQMIEYCITQSKEG